jgi:hypothetical protein
MQLSMLFMCIFLFSSWMKPYMHDL